MDEFSPRQGVEQVLSDRDESCPRETDHCIVKERQAEIRVKALCCKQGIDGGTFQTGADKLGHPAEYADLNFGVCVLIFAALRL